MWYFKKEEKDQISGKRSQPQTSNLMTALPFCKNQLIFFKEKRKGKIICFELLD